MAYVRTGAAAEAIGVAAQTLRDWMRSGRVRPAFRSEKRGDAYWDVDDLRRQLERGPMPRQPEPVAQRSTVIRRKLSAQERRCINFEDCGNIVPPRRAAHLSGPMICAYCSDRQKRGNRDGGTSQLPMA